MNENANTVFVYSKGRSRYGHRYMVERFEAAYLPMFETEDDKNRQWHKRLDKAVKCLQKSCLWDELLPVFCNLQKVTLADKKEISDIFWRSRRYACNPIDKTTAKEELGLYQEKYPFMFTTDEDGDIQVKTDYIFELSDCNIKPMYFGKYRNADEKAKITAAINDRRSYETSARTSYDVSFRYDAGKNKAWYSEEYKNCGNGHYYLALDGNTALFCEND